MKRESYLLTLADFKRVFKFGTDYYIDPKKNTTGRTTGEPRGLGAILDSFTLGKLTEIGIEKILKETYRAKDYVLDFEIKANVEVMDEPDVIGVYENDQIREPNVFIEIKNTSEKDRWIGLTEEQFNTIKRGANRKKIYLIYASIQSQTIDNNPKTTDLTGMFLKEIEDPNKSEIFQKFANLNAKCQIEFILSEQDIHQFAFPFERGMNMYETNLFTEKNKNNAYNSEGQLRKDILESADYFDFNSTMDLEIKNGVKTENTKLSRFLIKGSFRLLKKKSTCIIECLSDVKLSNDIFGIFNLDPNKFYSFNLNTVGRDPKLKRNNLFIAKRRVYQLIENGDIRDPIEIVTEIATDI